MNIWAYVSLMAAFSLGYLIGYSKGKSVGQVEGINFAEQKEQNRRMTEQMTAFFGGNRE